MPPTSGALSRLPRRHYAGIGDTPTRGMSVRLVRLRNSLGHADCFLSRRDVTLHQSLVLGSLRSAPHGVHIGELTPTLRRRLEAELMNPHVGAEFNPFVHWHRLMQRALVCRHGLVVEGGWPKDRAPFFGGDGDPAFADRREGRLASRLGVVEIHEEGEHAWALRRPECRVLVVMPLVELARLIANNLEILPVVEWRARQLVDPPHDAVDVLVGEALREVAPALEGGANGIQLVAGKRAFERLLAHILEGLRLFIGYEVVVLHHPRRP
mmetsp:Transcript_47272/g.106562  ORF Transcript_47272/g.106562 Transcript_47272/m.106562 type:complete len:268 (+) Transcript_47272:576-1379(+)